MSIIDRAAFVAMQAAREDATEARQIRNDGRAKEAEERVARATADHHANHKEVRLNITKSAINLGFSWLGALGQIASKAIVFAIDDKQGHKIADVRRQANLALARADLARAKAEDANADVDARRREIDKASEQALSMNDRIKDAVKIA